MGGRYESNSINTSQYESKPTRSKPKEDSPSVQAFRQIENSIILNPKAIRQLRLIAEESNRHTYSDTIIFLIKHYRDTNNRSVLHAIETGYGQM